MACQQSSERITRDPSTHPRLLAAAAWVFVEAKAITTRETSGDLSQKLSQAKTKLDTDVSEQNRAKDELNAAVDPIIKMIGRALESGGTAMTLELLDGTNKIKDASMIATEVQNHGPTGTGSINIRIFVSGHRTNSSSGLLEPYQILYFDRTLTSDDLTKLVNGKNLWEPKDLSSLVNQFDRLSHAVEIDAGALSRIAYEMHSAEIAKAAGEEPASESSGNLSLPFLLQLNITRFGTITLVSIAIAILVPLYRFSERLSAFYRARSDSLRLHQAGGYKSVGIIRLSAMLTPNIDYGKSQTMPNHLVEMLRLSARKEQDE